MSVTISGTNGIDKVQDGTIQSADFAAGVPGRSNLPAGTVLQVVSTTVANAISFGLTSTYQNFTGLNVAITPTSSSSKFFVVVSTTQGSSNIGTASVQVTRNGTAVGNGSGAALVNSAAATYFQGSTGYAQAPMVMQYVDSPATASAITYQVQVASDNSGTYYFNRRNADTNWSSQSTITVMEVAA